MKNKVRVRGQLKTYLQWPLLMTALVVLMNLAAGFVNSIAGLVMSVFTQDFETACSMVITSMSNVGCGFGEGGALGDFSYMNGFCCLFLSALMLIGRLEILTVLVLFTRSFWRN